MSYKRIATGSREGFGYWVHNYETGEFYAFDTRGTETKALTGVEAARFKDEMDEAKQSS